MNTQPASAATPSLVRRSILDDWSHPFGLILMFVTMFGMIAVFAQASGNNDPMARSGAAKVCLLDGSILIAGGWDGSVDRADAIIWNPATQSFASIAPMGAPRESPLARLLGDGRVLVAGGTNRLLGTRLSSAEIFDPATGRWTWVGPMSSPRYDGVGASAVLLADGRVRVAAGHAGFDLRGDFETFDPRSASWSTAGAPAVASIVAAPVLNGFMISQGASATVSASVTLDHTILGGQPTEFIASENSDFSGTDWKPYVSIPAFSLSAGQGMKQVYFKLRNSAGESLTLMNVISYDPRISIDSFAINAGRATTKSLSVTLDHAVVGSCAEFLASENPDFLGAIWQPEADAPVFVLSPSTGVRTVYFKVRNGKIESSVAIDTIRFNGK